MCIKYILTKYLNIKLYLFEINDVQYIVLFTSFIFYNYYIYI